MRDYIFSRLLSIGAKTDDDASDVLFGRQRQHIAAKRGREKGRTGY